MKEKLHPFHVTFLIYMIQAGVVVFSLPRLIAAHMGYNGWITLFLFLGLTSLNILLISFVYRLSGGQSIFQIIEAALPKFIVVPLYVFVLSVWSLCGCIAAKQYVNIYQIFVFPTAHPMLIKFLVDILTLLLIMKGIYNITKAATIFFWLVIWTILLLLFFVNSISLVDYTPFFLKEAREPLQGGMNIYSAFLGYELSLLLFPYAQKGKGFIRAVYVGNLFTAITYILICIVCFGFYSFYQLQRMKFPVIDLLSYIELPFVERIENLIFSVFVFTALIGNVMYAWSAIQTAHRIIPKANIKWLSLIIVILAYAVSWIPNVLSEVEKWLLTLGYLEFGIAFGLPMLLIIILLFRARRNEPCADYS